MNKTSYYIGITVGNKVLKTESLAEFKLRNDVIHIFKATYSKATAKNVFYNINYFRNGEIIESPIEIEVKGFKTFYYFGEFWGEFYKNIKGQCIQFDIPDLTGIYKKVNFSTYPEPMVGLENYLIYLDDLSRLGTHQAILEIKDLNTRINNLKSQIDKLKIKIK